MNLSDDVRELSVSFGDVELFISRDRQSPGRRAGAVSAPAATAAVSPVPASTEVPATADSAPAAVAPNAAPTPVAPAPAAVAPNAAPALPAALDVDEVVIKAPMVGTFYGAPKPGDPPFVQVGDSVTDETVLGIVEVMKLMNNIEAKVVGTVARILVENDQAVEYGQPLMVIRRHG
ncbi:MULTISPECIES: acetyl-CoA carboxylase biotin carboxyl carrier protein [unclassified Rathayibacter]|uniref:acetyl-CoA carboxylase biotin carboxyl carrier protein n=1 Tax=unclassified Rathayibacter TaxID=2609250 RepID=UPI001AAD8942|nr:MULTISPECIES: acetyl-CoA carboxylase biotin carboxyl carrier protein [unclassified Rathayibacter]